MYVSCYNVVTRENVFGFFTVQFCQNLRHYFPRVVRSTDAAQTRAVRIQYFQKEIGK